MAATARRSHSWDIISIMALRIPKGCVDLTAEHGTTTFAVIGVARRSVPTDTERQAAYHEAGHAVCGRTLGLASGGATIEPDGVGHANVAGHLSIHNDFIASGGYRDFLSSVFLKMQVCLAGPEAERIAFGDCDARGDMVQIRELCRRYNISMVDVVDRQLRPQVHGLLLQHWSTVEAVAAALFEKKTLSGAEIDKLCNF